MNQQLELQRQRERADAIHRAQARQQRVRAERHVMRQADQASSGVAAADDARRQRLEEVGHV